MLNPTFSGNVGGNGPPSDLAPLTARVAALESFGVDVPGTLPVEVVSDLVAGVPSDFLRTLWPALDEVGYDLFVSEDGMAPRYVVLSADLPLSELPAFFASYPGVAVAVEVVSAADKVGLRLKSSSSSVSLSGPAADILGIQGDHVGEATTLRRIAADTSVQHGVVTTSEAIDAVKAVTASIKRGYRFVTVPSVEYPTLYSALAVAGNDALSGTRTIIEIVVRELVENVAIEEGVDLSGVEISPGHNVSPIYLGDKLAVASVSGTVGAWDVVVSGVPEYASLEEVTVGDDLVLSPGMQTISGAADQMLVGIHRVLSVDVASRRLTVRCRTRETVSAGPISGLVFGVVRRCRIVGADVGYYSSVFHIRQGARLGKIRGLGIRAPEGRTCSALVVDGELGGGIYDTSPSSLLTLVSSAQGGEASALRVGPLGRCSAAAVIAGDEGYGAGTGVLIEGVFRPQMLCISGMRGDAPLYVKGSFSAENYSVSVRGNWGPVIADLGGKVGLRVQPAIIGNNGDGVQVRAMRNGVVEAAGTAWTCDPPADSLGPTGGLVSRKEIYE